MEIPKLKLTIASGIILLALCLHFFVAISLPYIPAFHIVETSFNSNNTKQDVAIGNSQKLTQIRLGIWAACHYSQNDSASGCSKAASPYNVTITENKSQITAVELSWTRGLPLQVVAGGLTLIAFIAEQFFSNYHLATLIAVGLAGVASVLALLIELALFLLVKRSMQTLEARAITDTGPGFWMTFISTLLLSGVGAVFLWLFLTDKSRRINGPKILDNPTKSTDPQAGHPQPPQGQPPQGPPTKAGTFNPPSHVQPLPPNQGQTTPHSHSQVQLLPQSQGQTTPYSHSQVQFSSQSQGQTTPHSHSQVQLLPQNKGQTTPHPNQDPPPYQPPPYHINHT